MKKLLLAGSVALLLVGVVVTVASARGGGNGNGKAHLAAELEGFQEVPSISTKAHGEIKVKVNGSSIKYELRYRDFDSPVLFAHIHFAQEGVNGGVAAFLCGGNGKPACPQGSGTVTGTITADNVKAIAAQGLAANDIGGLIGALKAGYTYANVHSQDFDSGEIRGQIGDDDNDHHRSGRGKHDDDHDQDEDDD
jgi:hypothetical protein